MGVIFWSVPFPCPDFRDFSLMAERSRPFAPYLGLNFRHFAPQSIRRSVTPVELPRAGNPWPGRNLSYRDTELPRPSRRFLIFVRISSFSGGGGEGDRRGYILSILCALWYW